VIEADLDILFELARLAERYLPGGELYDPVGAVEEFARTIREELDFTREGRHMEIFKHNFAGDETIYVPKVFWEYTTPRVLVMEYIQGIKISDLEQLEAAGLDRKAIARNGAQAILKQVFEHGFFHADPHPGNLLVLPGNVTAPLDFGMMGRLDEGLRGQVAELLAGFVKKDVDRIIGALQEMGSLEAEVDTQALRTELLGLIDYYYGVPLKRLDFRRIFEEGMALVRSFQIKVPTGLVLMGKALVTEEGVGRMLDPDFDMVSMAKPYVQRLLLQRYDPRRQLAKWLEILDGYQRMLVRLPTDVQAALAGLAELGRASAIHGEERSRDRLSLALIASALFLGSSLIIQSGTGPQLWGVPVLGLLGYVGAAVLVGWLLWGLRSGRA
ncbi:MAG TPA: ubiquinone biosynthesis protein UbiB, partial [Candidatus Acetothermia bacterium]|nr:ubiquinone biosynthesis protein UbiB [Candidatus Acetothermia bacterium]